MMLVVIALAIVGAMVWPAPGSDRPEQTSASAVNEAPLTTYTMAGISMEPTFVHEEDVSVRLGGVAGRGDIALIRLDDQSQVSGGTLTIKRIIAVGPDLVEIIDGEVWVNGMPLVEPYVAAPQSTALRTRPMPGCEGESTERSCLLTPGTVFILGDNRRGSVDSRVFGPLRDSEIIGVVVE